MYTHCAALLVTVVVPPLMSSVQGATVQGREPGSYQ